MTNKLQMTKSENLRRIIRSASTITSLSSGVLDAPMPKTIKRVGAKKEIIMHQHINTKTGVPFGKKHPIDADHAKKKTQEAHDKSIEC